jgi:hypothetical protein
MLRKVKLQVSEVKTIGLKKSQPVDLIVDKDITYKQFAECIKDKIPLFDRKKYVVFLPQLAGITIDRHNFREYIESASREVKSYAEVHIQRKVLDRDVDLKFSSSDSDEEDEMVLMGAMFDDDGLPPESANNFLRRELPGNPTDSRLKLYKEDCALLTGLKVVKPREPPHLTINEIKTVITKGITDHLTQC